MRTTIDVAIIINVRKLRLRDDVSQRVLAEAIGATPGFIGQVESDKFGAKYSADHIYQIAKFFECDFSDIFPPVNSIEP